MLTGGLLGALLGGLLVGIGGAFGAGTRWAVTRRLGDRVGTLAVNAVGSLLAGLLAGAGPSLRLLLATGFCGGLTTFSSYAVQVRARLDARPAPGRRLALVHLAVCLPAAALGLALTGRAG